MGTEKRKHNLVALFNRDCVFVFCFSVVLAL